jgi:hypothetical protein
MLFGHQNDSNSDNNSPAATPVPVDQPTAPVSADPGPGVDLPSVSPQNLESDTISPETTPAQPTAAHALETPDPASSTPAHDDVLSPSPDDDLLNLKQQALQQLGPLVDHLDQSPEEKFRTTMMMIQSSDNQALIKTAYAAAQAIPDSKARAQALLDIVNEINYFTQQAQNN